MTIDQRKSARRTVSQGARMLGLHGTALGACFLADVSAGGARLFIKPTVDVPDRFILALSWTLDLRRECSVVWRTKNTIGVRFVFRPAANKHPKAH